MVSTAMAQSSAPSKEQDLCLQGKQVIARIFGSPGYCDDNTRYNGLRHQDTIKDLTDSYILYLCRHTQANLISPKKCSSKQPKHSSKKSKHSKKGT